MRPRSNRIDTMRCAKTGDCGEQNGVPDSTSTVWLQGRMLPGAQEAVFLRRYSSISMPKREPVRPKAENERYREGLSGRETIARVEHRTVGASSLYHTEAGMEYKRFLQWSAGISVLAGSSHVAVASSELK
jgi:hypothetical protein